MIYKIIISNNAVKKLSAGSEIDQKNGWLFYRA